MSSDSLSTSISGLFFLAMIIGVLGLVAVLFLKEAPLRRTHAEVTGEAGDTGLLEGTGPGRPTSPARPRP